MYVISEGSHVFKCALWIHPQPLHKYMWPCDQSWPVDPLEKLSNNYLSTFLCSRKSYKVFIQLVVIFPIFFLIHLKCEYSKYLFHSHIFSYLLVNTPNAIYYHLFSYLLESPYDFELLNILSKVHMTLSH